MKRLVLLTTLLLTLLSGLTMTAPPRAHAQTFSCNNVTEIPIAECNELVTLYNSTGGANWKNNTGWLTTNTPCSWFGIICNGGQVSKIELGDDGNNSDNNFGNNLTGIIPNLNLPNLIGLNLRFNALNGNIPNFSQLPNLTGLYLGSNQLSGNIPDFGNLPNLTVLSLWNNQLSGNIPNFSNLPNLRGLAIDSNQLSGSIPNFANSPNLTEINFSFNHLSGIVPNLNWASFSTVKLNNNCGLMAFDDAQATVLMSKDPDWQVRNPNCIPPTNTPTLTPSPTPTHTPTPTPVPPDAYETDNACAEAKPIATKGLAQSHTFHVAGDEDWSQFTAISGTTYIIEVRVPDTSWADVALELYDRCGAVYQQFKDAFNPEIKLTFKAANSGEYYLKLFNHDLDMGGVELTYQLLVRQLEDKPSPGVLVLVAGKLKANDPLQSNIHQVTNSVYKLFLNNGYTSDRIYYLATDPSLNPDPTTTEDVDGVPNRDNLRNAITEWTKDKQLGPDRAFTLYLMDHGDKDMFFLNTRTQTVNPTDLSSWLDTLESQVPGVKINVIMDACYAGSFIDLPQTISKVNSKRLVIASTSSATSAYASQEGGAIFSDYFLQVLGRGLSLYSGFAEGQLVAQTWHNDQTPWLDSNGNGVPNEKADFEEAQQRGFSYAGTFAENDKLPPWISLVLPPDKIENRAGLLKARVDDDIAEAKLTVWAVIYKPSYVPPAPGTELVSEFQQLSTVRLLGPDKDKFYQGLYENFVEPGTYRIVIYAVDEDGLQGRPREIMVTIGKNTYLPMIVK